MPDEARKVFYGLLRDNFAPELRNLGFKGSGSNFRRIRGDVINTVNIQGNKYGGSSAVNLGLHVTFLPVSWKDELPDVSKIKEVECEFRNRLAPKRKSDYWWKYSGLFRSATKQVEHLVETYLRFGEPAFSAYDTVEKIAGMITVDDVSEGRFNNAFGRVTSVRAALTMARIHRHIGNESLARAFAEVGLDNIGQATALRSDFQEILDSD